MGGVNTDRDFSLDFDQPVVLIEYSENFFLQFPFLRCPGYRERDGVWHSVGVATLLLYTITSSWRGEQAMVSSGKDRRPFWKGAIFSSFWEGVNINPSVLGSSAALLVPASVFPPECHYKPIVLKGTGSN